MNWELDIFRNGWHCGYLVDSGFFAKCHNCSTRQEQNTNDTEVYILMKLSQNLQL